MKVRFCLNYRTQPGEKLHVLVYRAGAGANEQKINIPLTAKTKDCWTGEIQLLLRQPLQLNYYYEVRQGMRTIRQEWRAVARVLELNPKADLYISNDSWRDVPRDGWLYTTCLTNVWRRREHNTESLPLFKRTLMIRAHSAKPDVKEQLWVCGSGTALGDWDPQKAQKMQEIAPNEWAVSLDADKISFPFEYKFLVRPSSEKTTDDSETVVWEQGKNRTSQIEEIPAYGVYILSDQRPIFEWKTPVRVAGMEVPLFSLRSTNGWGCGDFGDLATLVDWAVQTGQRAIQLLPLQDTTFTHSWLDSSPYKILSTYALHPIYADMRTLPPISPEEEEEFEKVRDVLNKQPKLIYESVLQLKLKRLQRAFEEEGADRLASGDFRAFYQANSHWLQGYAMFCVLRDRFGTSDHTRWPQYVFFAREDANQFCALGAPDEKEVRFWYYVQYILHTQLLQASQYARQHGVALIADVPLGVPTNSIDVWMDPVFFNLNSQAGAPPDALSATGQNWELPTYNWDAMARDGYRWWERRMAHLAQYFDAYRLDHVQGFFRMWAIPRTATQGILGQFVPAKGLTPQEMEKFGFHFTKEVVNPYISKEIVEDVFGVLAQHVTENYLTPLPSGLFALQEKYNTQRKIVNALPGEKPETALLRRGLCELAANVLFVEDVASAGLYHPRVFALTSNVLGMLTPPQQEAYKKLYESYFSTRQNDLWKEEAMKRLPAIVNRVPMLCCAEDLGILPACLPEVTDKLNMLRLEIQRMPKEEGVLFSDTAKNPYLSVTMPGTHDMSVLRAWWKEHPGYTQRFWLDILHQSGESPSNASHQICEDIVRLQLESPSMIALFLLADWTGLDKLLRSSDPEAERINDPANPHHYWCYRMPIALEDLLEQTGFNQHIRELIEQSGRI